MNPSHSRALLAAALAFLPVATAFASTAAEHEAGHGPARAAAPPKPAEPAPAASAPLPAAVEASANAPIERLYQRLSEKLGTVRQPTNDGTLVLKVPARPQLVAAAAPSAKAARKPALIEEKEEVLSPARHEHAHWGYEGAVGPQAWAALSPENARCASGTRQSPLDLRDGFKVQLDPIGFSYQADGFSVVDNGHTVQVDPGLGNTMSVLGRHYRLKQFHFHRPSETRVNGRSFEMEVHLVHQDDEGRLAVVGVLFERGAANAAVQQVWNNLPLEKGEPQRAGVVLDPAGLLPADRRYWTFMGSLTTPPCSEGVLWMVMKQPVPLSPEQIALFARLYPMNARPVQALAGRMVKESD